MNRSLARPTSGEASASPVPWPRTLEAITPAWLTAALASELGGARVVAFESEPVGVGVGFVGLVYRLELVLDRAPAGAPASVIVKLPNGEPGARAMARTFRHYEKEVGFYRDIQTRNPLVSPRLFSQAFDPQTDDFVLLLEDLARATPGDQRIGLTVDEAAIAVEAAAGMHARWWQSPELDAIGWLPAIDHPSLLALEPAFQRCWGAYRDFAGDEVSAAITAAGERLSSRITPLLHRLARRPWTLVHGDYRADNFLFRDDASPFLVVDWQIVFKGPGIHDVAYLLAGNLSPADRRAAEGDLIRLYIAALRAGGVTGYDFDEAWRDYRISVVTGWLWPVMGIGSLDLANARGVAVFHQWNQRIAAAIEDLDAAEAVWRFLD